MTATTAPTADTDSDAAFLRAALRANVLLSTTTGGAALLGCAWLAAPLGVPTPLLAGLGLGLLGFAALVAGVTRRRDGLQRSSRWIVVADLLWVVGAIPIVLSDLLPAPGDVVVTVTTLAVAIVATAQIEGLRRST